MRKNQLTDDFETLVQDCQRSLAFSEYVDWTDETAIYPEAGTGSGMALSYVYMGYVSEVGEVYGVLKKEVRDNAPNAAGLKSELSDLMWYVARIIRESQSPTFDLEAWSELDFASLLHENDITLLHQFTQIMCMHGWTLEEILELNKNKLLGRKARGTIGGSGEDR